MAVNAILQKAPGIFSIISKQRLFDRVLKKIKLVSVNKNEVVAELIVNGKPAVGALHNRLTATLVDTMASVAEMSIKSDQPGIDFELSISFKSPAKKGDLVIITAECLNTGETMAFTTAELRLKGGALIPRTNHIEHSASLFNFK